MSSIFYRSFPGPGGFTQVKASDIDIGDPLNFTGLLQGKTTQAEINEVLDGLQLGASDAEDVGISTNYAGGNLAGVANQKEVNDYINALSFSTVSDDVDINLTSVFSGILNNHATQKEINETLDTLTDADIPLSTVYAGNLDSKTTLKDVSDVVDSLTLSGLDKDITLEKDYSGGYLTGRTTQQDVNDYLNTLLVPKNDSGLPVLTEYIGNLSGAENQQDVNDYIDSLTFSSATDDVDVNITANYVLGQRLYDKATQRQVNDVLNNLVIPEDAEDISISTDYSGGRLAGKTDQKLVNDVLNSLTIPSKAEDISVPESYTGGRLQGKSNQKLVNDVLNNLVLPSKDTDIGLSVSYVAGNLSGETTLKAVSDFVNNLTVTGAADDSELALTGNFSGLLDDGGITTQAHVNAVVDGLIIPTTDLDISLSDQSYSGNLDGETTLRAVADFVDSLNTVGAVNDLQLQIETPFSGNLTGRTTQQAVNNFVDTITITGAEDDSELGLKDKATFSGLLQGKETQDEANDVLDKLFIPSKDTDIDLSNQSYSGNLSGVNKTVKDVADFVDALTVTGAEDDSELALSKEGSFSGRLATANASTQADVNDVLDLLVLPSVDTDIGLSGNYQNGNLSGIGSPTVKDVADFVNNLTVTGAEDDGELTLTGTFTGLLDDVGITSQAHVNAVVDGLVIPEKAEDITIPEDYTGGLLEGVDNQKDVNDIVNALDIPSEDKDLDLSFVPIGNLSGFTRQDQVNDYVDKLHLGSSVTGSDTNITQASHGLSVLDVVGPVGSGDWGKVKAGYARGVVVKVESQNKFRVAFGSIHEIQAHGLTVDRLYYADPDTAGAYTSTKPSSVAQPIFYTLDNNNILVKVFTPEYQDYPLKVSHTITGVDATDNSDNVVFNVGASEKFIMERLLITVTDEDNVTEFGTIEINGNEYSLGKVPGSGVGLTSWVIRTEGQQKAITDDDFKVNFYDAAATTLEVTVTAQGYLYEV